MELDLSAVKSAIETQNRAFDEFKRTNDERLKQVEQRGIADPLLQQKLDKINADLDKTAGITDAFASLQAKVNRIETFGVGKAGAVDSTELGEYRQAVNRFLRKGDNMGAVIDLSARVPELRAMSVGSDPDGGVAVSPDTSGRVITKLFESSPIRQYASVQVISTDALEGLRDTSEAAASWVAETGARAESTTPTLAKWRIPVHEQFAQPAATQSLLDDANINVESWLADKVADKFARAENAAFVTGNGVGKPRGFASYTTNATADSSRAWGVFEHVATGAAGSYGAAPNGSDKLIDLVHKMNAAYLPGAIWAMNKLTLGETRKLKANNEYIWLPSMQAGAPSQLLGFPVVAFEDMANFSVADSLAVAFGNFSIAYQIVDRVGIRVLRDPYTNKPYVRFYTTKRVGGDVVHFEAIKFVKFS